MPTQMESVLTTLMQSVSGMATSMQTLADSMRMMQELQQIQARQHQEKM